MKKRILFLSVSSLVIVTSVALSGCSNSAKEDSGMMVANDEIMQGPGIFTGKKGAYYLMGGRKTPPVQTTHSNDKKNDSEVIQEINNKLKQLDKDKIELEEMKSQLRNRLK